MEREYFRALRNAVLVTALLSAPTSVEAAVFPAPLLGNSVIVSWTGSMQMVFAGSDQVVSRNGSAELSVYISTAGRAFSKMFRTSSGGGGGPGGGRRGGGRGVRTMESEQGPGDRTTSMGGSRVVHFEGGALLVENRMISGARRIAITFDSGYGSCSARLIFGKEGGAALRARAFNGRPYEVVSLQTSTPTCSIKPGNVFGAQ